MVDNFGLFLKMYSLMVPYTDSISVREIYEYVYNGTSLHTGMLTIARSCKY